MSKLPFIVPEYDLGVRLSRILVIIAFLSYTRQRKAILTLNKIAVFEFLVKHPHILKDVLSAEGKDKGFHLLESETGTIESQFPTVLSLFDYGVIKGYMRLLLCYGYVEVHSGKQICYTVTDRGKKWIDTLNSPYISRVKVLCNLIVPLRSLKTAELVKKVTPFIQGV